MQKQHTLLQQELNRCRQLGQEKAQEVAVLEARLRESEGERQRLEREADEARRQLATPRLTMEAVWIRKGAEPRRRSLPAGDALYQSFTPPLVSAITFLLSMGLVWGGSGLHLVLSSQGAAICCQLHSSWIPPCGLCPKAQLWWCSLIYCACILSVRFFLNLPSKKDTWTVKAARRVEFFKKTKRLTLID